MGGPSIIFHCYHEAGQTKLRSPVYNEKAKTCQKISGFDANALYLYCLMQPMPVGTYVRHKDGFKPHQSDPWGKTASEWMEWVASTTRRRSSTSTTAKKSVLEEDVCLWMVPCYQYCLSVSGMLLPWLQGITKNEKNGKTMEELRRETEKFKLH